ncbi:MAG: hypothetical protein ACRDTU_15060 [Micromonosporaceae bacterium]
MSMEEFTELLLAVARPPYVSVTDVARRGQQEAALLVLARHHPTGRWAAGVSWIHNEWRGSPVRALLTAWVPLEKVSRTRRTGSVDVPRVMVTGSAEGWPRLPAHYPQITDEWRRRHQHLTRPGPDGLYVPAPRSTGPDWTTARRAP